MAVRSISLYPIPRDPAIIPPDHRGHRRRFDHRIHGNPNAAVGRHTAAPVTGPGTMGITVRHLQDSSIVSGYLPSTDPADQFDDQVLMSCRGGQFTGDFSAWRTGRLLGCDVANDAASTAKRIVPHDGRGTYIVGALLEGEASYVGSTGSTILTPSSLIVYPAQESFFFSYTTAFHYTLIAVTAEELRVPESSLARLAQQIQVEASPFSAALTAFMRAGNCSAVASLSAHDLADVGEYATQMVRRIVARSDENHFGRSGDTRLAPILAWIEQNLSDLRLGPERVAEAHHVSLRQLHRLFTGTGTTCSQYILRRRLERIREDILRYDPDASLTTIALRWGIDDPSYLSKVFRKHFGTSPREARRRRA
ncbi:helix-turn-helix transcriptional regulator [Streptomyces turgidiscabies]|nr:MULTISPECIES: AraC family transcriptional regulator [Streptomyces]MDX3498097.1 AraC family transcriptional regulator [Streptomyces turgidiscabies]